MPAQFTSILHVPTVGPVVASDGRVLWTRELRDFAFNRDGVWRGRDAAISAAAADGQVLCVRGAGAGLTIAEASDLAWHDLESIVAFDPYDSDGKPIIVDGVDLRTFAADRVGKVAA